MSPHVETIVRFLADLVDGQPMPSEDSEAVLRLSGAVRALQAGNAPADYEMLGLKALGLVIDRARSALAARQALRNLGPRQ